MKGKVFHYRWVWRLNSSPDRLWALVSDTNRFNHDTGVPALQRGGNASTGTGHRRLSLSRYGVAIEWEEEPFEWVRPERFGVLRRYMHGPLREMRILVELGSEPGGGTHVVYQVWAQPANLLGRWGIPIQIGLIQRRRFAAVFRQYDRQAAQPSSQVAREEPVQFVAGGKQRLESRQAALLGQGIVPTLVTELVTTLTNAGDLDVYRMRPYELADRWEASRRGVLELCLHAARIGILDSRWEILCPLCRGTEGSTTSLKEIRSTVHCESCNIDYTVNFERLVELVFRPNAAIRRVDVGEFCVGGPGVSSIGRSATRPLLVGS